LNITFVFSTYEAKLSQWSYLYTRLPYLLLYTLSLVEHIASGILPTNPDYLEDRVFWKSSGRFWGVKAVKGPVDIGFWRLGPARKFGIMGDGEIGQGTASAVGWIFVLGLSGSRDRSWRIW